MGDLFMGMDRKKAIVPLVAAALVGAVVLGFQNCAPQSYFKAKKVSDDSSYSSTSPSSGTSVTLDPNNRYQVTLGILKPTDAGVLSNVNIDGRIVKLVETNPKDPDGGRHHEPRKPQCCTDNPLDHRAPYRW